MRKTSLLFALLALLICISAESCRHKGDEPGQPDFGEQDTSGNGSGSDRITITEWPLRTVTEAGGQTHIKFNTTGNWTLAASEESSFWITAAPGEGETGNHLVTFNIRENMSYDERNASFMIRCGQATQLITITQKQVDAIMLTSGKVELDSQEQSFELEVRANVDYISEVSADARAWLMPELSKALKTNILKFRVTANESMTPREGVITLKSASVIEEVHVYQKGKKQTIVISNRQVHLPPEGGEVKVEIQSNTDYNELAPQNNWLMKDMDRTQSAYTIYYKAAENLLKENRSCILVFTSADRTAKDTVHITQDAFVDQFEVKGDKEYSFKSTGGEFSIEVSSNTDYTISLPGPWIKGDTEGLKGTNTHTFSIPRNYTYDRNEGNIVISNADKSITETIKVTQDQKVDGLTIISYPTETMGREAGKDIISLDASERWVATVSAGARTWLKTTPASGEEDVTSFEVSVSANNTFESRSGVITVTCGSVSRDITITQNGIETVLKINLGAEGVATDYEGGPVEIQVYSNTDYTITKPDWLKGDIKGAPGNNRHVFQVPANNSSQDRNGEIVVATTNGKKSAVIPVSQSKYVDVLNILDVNFTTLAASGQDAMVRFDSNKDWTATVSDNAKSWLTLNPKNGGKAGKNVDLIVVASMNTLFTKRYGTVTITSGSLSEKLEFVQQAAEPSLVVKQGMDGFDTDYHGSSVKIAVSANLDYTISTPKWVHGQTAGTAGDNTIFFSIDDNLTYENRSGFIVLSNAEHGIREEIPVSQGKKFETLKVSASALVFEKISPDKTLTITASDPWTASVSADAQKWLSISPASGNSGITGTVVTVLQNTSFDIRTGQITFTCGREQKTVDITQNAEIARLVVTSEAEIKNINYKGATIKATISSNCDYTIQTPDWITGETSGKAGTNTHTFTVGLNATYGSRTGDLVFSNSQLNVSAKVPVTQNKKFDELDVTKAPENIIPAEGGESSITFVTNGNWTATGDDYLTFSQSSGGEGEYTITVTAGPNHTPVARNPRVTLACGSAKRTVELTQTGEKAYLTVRSAKIVKTGAPAQSIEITVEANSKYTITCPAWAACAERTGTAGTNVHTIALQENTAATQRTGDIQFKSISYNVSDLVKLIQDAAAE